MLNKNNNNKKIQRCRSASSYSSRLKKIGSLLKKEMDKMTLISLNQVSFQSRMMAPHHFSKVKSSIQMSWFWTWEAQGAAKAKKKKSIALLHHKRCRKMSTLPFCLLDIKRLVSKVLKILKGIFNCWF